MQERPPAATRTTDLPRRQQLAHLDAVSTGVGIERADRRKLAIHSGFRAVMRHRRQHSDPPVAGLQRQPQPRDELTHILKPHRPPIQPTIGEEGEPVLQIMRIRLDRRKISKGFGVEIGNVLLVGLTGLISQYTRGGRSWPSVAD